MVGTNVLSKGTALLASYVEGGQMQRGTGDSCLFQIVVGIATVPSAK